MLKKFKGIFNYFNYFRAITGNKIFLLLLFNILVGLTDGIGLAMFVPIISQITLAEVSHEHLGRLQYLTILLENLGIKLDLFNLLIILVIIFSLKGFLTYLRSIYFQKIKLESVRKLRLEMVHHMRFADYFSFSKISAGKVQNAMHAEIVRLVDALSNYIKSIEFLVVMCTYFALAFYINWEFALFVTLTGLLAMLLYSQINKLTAKESYKLSSAGNLYQGKVLQAVNYFKYLKATNRFSDYEDKLKQDIQNIENSNYQIGKLNAILDSLKEPFVVIIISVVIIFQLIFLNSNIATIIIGLLLFFRALTYLMTMQITWNRFVGDSASIQSIENMRNLLKHNSETNGEIDDEFFIGDISLKNVSVKVENKHIIKNVNLVVPAQQTIALVGESGAGKTTLANIICGLITPTSGDVFANGKKLEPHMLQSMRQKVGYITQEQVVFDDTLFNNITFWDIKTEENLAKFHQVMEMVSLKLFVENLPHGADTRLGHQGISISGGQKQRISIARELYREVELLVMDEATSSLDSETELIIQQNIEQLHGKYTLVIIAHRLSTVKNADQVLIMENGSIVKQGKFDELFANNEKFRNMVYQQKL